MKLPKFKEPSLEKPRPPPFLISNGMAAGKVRVPPGRRVGGRGGETWVIRHVFCLSPLISNNVTAMFGRWQFQHQLQPSTATAVFSRIPLVMCFTTTWPENANRKRASRKKTDAGQSPCTPTVGVQGDCPDIGPFGEARFGIAFLAFSDDLFPPLSVHPAP